MKNQQILDKLEELMDTYFPKGKCKERGNALMLYAMFYMWLNKCGEVRNSG